MRFYLYHLVRVREPKESGKVLISVEHMFVQGLSFILSNVIIYVSTFILLI